MMAGRRNRESLAALALGLAAAFVPVGSARAQHQSVDPYDPYGAPYRAFAFPVYRWTPDMYGRQGAPGGRAANLVDDYFDGGDLGFGVGTGRASGAGVPYYRAYRDLDEDFGRVGQSNQGLDEKFDRSMRARDRAYAEAMREVDPLKRARKLRAVDRMDLRASRGQFSPPREPSPRPRLRSTTRPEDSDASETRRPAGSAPPPVSDEARSPTRRAREDLLSSPSDRRSARRPLSDPTPSLSERLRQRREAARAAASRTAEPEDSSDAPPP